jgi:hypothetical protein
MFFYENQTATVEHEANQHVTDVSTKYTTKGNAGGVFLTLPQ